MGKIREVAKPSRQQAKADPGKGPSRVPPTRAQLQQEKLSFTEAVQGTREAKALAQPTRLILLSLMRAACGHGLSITALTALSDEDQSSVSRHIKILEEAGLVWAVTNHGYKDCRLTKRGEVLLGALLDQD